jgi:hypothetical protein
MSIPPTVKWSNWEGQLFDFWSNEEDIGRWKERKMGGGHPTVVWSHNATVSRATTFTPFWLMYGTKAMLPEEIKHQSMRTATETIPCPNEAEEKDLLDSDRLKAVVYLEKY